MTKTWLKKYDDGDLLGLLNVISSGRSQSATGYRYKRYNEAHQVVSAVREGSMTRECGRELLVRLIVQTRSSPPLPPPVSPPPVSPQPPPQVDSYFEDGISLQQRRARELKEKWSTLQEEIRAKVAVKEEVFRPRRLVRYKRVDNR